MMLSTMHIRGTCRCGNRLSESRCPVKQTIDAIKFHCIRTHIISAGLNRRMLKMIQCVLKNKHQA